MRLFWLFLLGVLVFACGAVATLPLSVAMAFVRDYGALEYGAVSGRIWQGTVQDLVVDGMPVGDVRLSVDALPLARATVQMRWAADGQNIVGQGRAERPLSGEGLTLKDTQMRFDIGELAVPLPVPILGDVYADISVLEISEQGCDDVVASVRTDLLARSAAAINWAGPVLEGVARCESGDLILPLEGENQTDRVRLTIRVSRDLSYRADVAVISDNTDLAVALGALGFDQSGNRFTHVIDGALTDARSQIRSGAS